ncbi:MAG: hypothetical protein NXI32_05570 [bacterium]|nr:hypothetical protein [bacterium]
MPFLSGSLAFERFHVSGFDQKAFCDEDIAKLERFASGQSATSSNDNVRVGFLGGEHLFDQHFDLGKNVINGALHAAIRIDTNDVPSAIRKAWLKMELAALTQDNGSRRPTKAQRQEAKDAVEARCEAEIATGKYHRMQSYPILWDLQTSILYIAGSGAAVIGHCTDLIERTFEVELSRITAGTTALDWARTTNHFDAVDDLVPETFIPERSVSEVAWTNEHSTNPDFLGNEFLLWLWFTLENETDTIGLGDESEVTAMLTKTLTLECPLGEFGKETISAESPVQLSEARQAIRSGKLPRKSGMTLVRDGQQFDLVLQAEMLAISGAKIHLADDDDPHDLDERINSIRRLAETVDLLFQAFCGVRVGKAWPETRNKISHWLSSQEALRRMPAA